MSLVPLVLLAGLWGASPEAPQVHRETRTKMHTYVTVAIAEDHPPEKLKAMFEAAFAPFDRVDQVMNEWRPESELSAINAQAGSAPVKAPADLCGLLQTAVDGARRTNGLFDPTWAALRDVWRFPEDRKTKVPEKQALAAACEKIDWTQVELAPLPRADAGAKADPGCLVRLKKPGMKLGLGGIAKGWGVDQAVAKLRALGAKNFFIQAGGDLYLGGKNRDRPWKVGIRDPRGAPDEIVAMVEVSDAAFSTSGDYERFFEAGGKRYHHIIDPRSCWPATASRSATVLAKSATDAEVLTKSVFILGPAEGLKLAESFGATAVVVDAKGKLHASEALKPRLKLTE